MLGNRYSFKDETRYEMISDEDERQLTVTIDRLSWYKFALEAAIREKTKILNNNKQSEGVKDVYKSIIKRYENEIDYINNLMWVKPDPQMTIFDLLESEM